MAFWEDMTSDPMRMMMLTQALGNFAGGLSKQNRPPSNAYVPQGYGYAQGGGGGGGFDMDAMLRMRALQMQGQNQQADNEFQRMQFEAQQQAAQQQRATLEQAARDMKVPLAVALANPEAVTSAWADRLKTQKLSPGEGLYADGEEIASRKALLDARDGGFADLENGTFTPNAAMQQNRLQSSAAGAARNSTTIVNKNPDRARELMLQAGIDQYKEMRTQANQTQDTARDLDEVAMIAADPANAPVFKSTAWIENIGRKVKSGLGNLTPEEKKIQAAYDRAGELQTAIATSKTAELRPASNLDFEEQLKATVGPGSEVPSTVLAAARYRANAAWEKKYYQEYERSLNEAIQDPNFNPVAHSVYMQQWANAPENSPYKSTSFQADLKNAMEAYGVRDGGKGKTAGAAPPSAGGSLIRPDVKSVMDSKYPAPVVAP